MVTFAERIKLAADSFAGGHSTAWVQYRLNGNDVKMRMQAPEVMKEFEGDVKFGQDPKGILFFRQGSLGIPTMYFRNAKYTVGGTKVVVETDFSGTENPFNPFARFVAEVDTSIYRDLPNFNTRVGRGTMRDFVAVTCHMNGNRPDGQSTVYLSSNSIHKQVHFTSSISTFFANEPGVLFFRLLSRLQDEPDGDGIRCVADYKSDVIVFQMENNPRKVVALFLPNKPITNIGTGRVRVTWTNIDPPAHFSSYSLLSTNSEIDEADEAA